MPLDSRNGNALAAGSPLQRGDTRAGSWCEAEDASIGGSEPECARDSGGAMLEFRGLRRQVGE